MDGTPLDGSRSMYLNALDASYAVGKAKLELLAISDPHRDIYLPLVSDKKKTVVEPDERALGLYFTDTAVPRTGLEAYYFYKAELNDTRAPGPAAQGDRRIHTLGGRATRELGAGWSARAELAGQAGRQDPGLDFLAWGLNAAVKRTFACTGKPSVSLGVVALSGDDPATPKVTAWDPLFSRWPKWSELYIYTLGTEKGGAYWSDLKMLQAEVLYAPLKQLNLRATYYRMGAFHPFPGKPAVFAGGLTRGDLYQLRADVKLNDSWRGHVMGEYLAPGSYYTGKDASWFFRVEGIYSFKRIFAI
jgi:hypothetical protein